MVAAIRVYVRFGSVAFLTDPVQPSPSGIPLARAATDGCGFGEYRQLVGFAHRLDAAIVAGAVGRVSGSQVGVAQLKLDPLSFFQILREVRAVPILLQGGLVSLIQRLISFLVTGVGRGVHLGLRLGKTRQGHKGQTS